jgi:hypothetical protein
MSANKLRSATAGVLSAPVLLLSAPLAKAEGGAGPEAMTMGNMCMVMFGYGMIHLTAYLPGRFRNEYCCEIPSTGKVILVLGIENPRFYDLPNETRIVRDPLTPLGADADLDPLTERHCPATVYKTGTFSFEHEFKNSEYIEPGKVIEFKDETRFDQADRGWKGQDGNIY